MRPSINKNQNNNNRIKDKPSSSAVNPNSNVPIPPPPFWKRQKRKTSNDNLKIKKIVYQEIDSPEPEPQEIPSFQLERSEPILPDYNKQLFIRDTQKWLPGKYSKQKGDKSGTYQIDERDCIGDFGIYSKANPNTGYCYTDGRWNYTNYRVERGTFQDRQAYKIHPPLTQPTQYQASYHSFCFKFKYKRNYAVYDYTYGFMHMLKKVPKEQVKPGQFVFFGFQDLCSMQQPYIFFVIAEEEEYKTSLLYNLKNNVQGATIFRSSNLAIQLTKYKMPCQAPYPQIFYFGPSNHKNCYTPNRDFFYIVNKGKQYLFWSQKSSLKFYLTQFDRDKMKCNTIQIKDKTNGYLLGAACGNDEDEIFYMEVEPGIGKTKTSTKIMNFVKCTIKGQQIKRQMLETDRNNIDLYRFDACQLAYSNGTIGMIITRQMTLASDNLNHQGAYATIYDSETLKPVRKIGGTTGHCFGLTIMSNNFKPNSYLAIQLGDLGPRGINHSQFDSKNYYKSKVVYTFKTLHGDQPKNPAGTQFPEYKEMSKKLGKKYYQWSNDNRTYTEMAAPGIINHQTGNIIIFVGENIPSSLDETQVGTYVNGPRNVGFVKASRDLEGPILSKGITQVGGYYGFRGKWAEQRHQGIKWLTKYTKKGIGNKIKAVGIKNKVFIIYQYWEDIDYIDTRFMLINLEGEIVIPETSIEFPVRLHRADDIYAKESSIVFFAGERESFIRRYQVLINPQVLY